MIKNILITGAGGQDGKIILQKLAKKKINLFLISRKFNKKKNYKNIYFVKLDLLHKKKLNIFFKKHKINTILHLAANNQVTVRIALKNIICKILVHQEI